MVTCVAAVLLGLDLGLAVGLGVELIGVVLRVQLSVYEQSLLFNAITDFIKLLFYVCCCLLKH